MHTSPLPSAFLPAKSIILACCRNPASAYEGPTGRIGCGLITLPLSPEAGYRVLVLILVFIVTVVRARYATVAPVIPVTVVLTAAGYMTGAVWVGRRPAALAGPTL